MKKNGKLLVFVILLFVWNLIEVTTTTPTTGTTKKNVTKKPRPTTHFLYPRGTTRLYDPHYGFKPYWPGGDWVLLKEPPTKSRPTMPTQPGETTTPSTTTEIPPTICGGEDCPPAYRNIKEVCVRYSRDWDWKMNEYKTHPTYCHYLKLADPGCIPRKYYGFVFVHLGACENNYAADGQSKPIYDRYYYTHYTPNNYLADVSPRLWWHMKRFSLQEEWTKYYSGSPYNITLFRAKKVFKK